MCLDPSEIIDFMALCNELNDFTGSQKHTTKYDVTVFTMVLGGS